MKVSIAIQHDTENSHPSALFEIKFGGALVFLKIDDSPREIAVKREDFEKLLALISK